MDNNMLKLKITHVSCSERCAGMWDSTTWEIYEDLTTEIFDSYRDTEKDKKYTVRLENIFYEEIMNNLEKAKQSDKKVEAFDGSAWGIVQYEHGKVIWTREIDYIYGIEPLECIANILEKTRCKSNDINLDRKELSEILELFHQEIKGIKPNEIDKSIYLKYLQLLKEKLNSKEYCSDKRFVTYCRRDFLRQEMIDRLEQNVYTGINYLLEAFYDLEDYINNDTWISIGSVCNIPNAKEIIDNDTSYKNDGKICKEEKEILVEMIDEFIKKVDPSLYNNIPEEDNSSVLLTLKEWWGEGSYGYEKIDVFYNGNVMLEEKNSTIDETGKKVEKERNEKITTLNEKDLACLSDIIQFINTSCKESETSMIFDYGVEIIINCGYLKYCTY